MKEPLFVTKSFLPPLKEYTKYLKRIWKNGVLTNDGEFVREFEAKLAKLAGTKYAFCTANATLALQIAIKAMGLKGEIITTPFSFIATTSSIIWEGLTPVYADIDSKTLNIDPEEIKRKLTPAASAIMAVHVYGNPCYVEEINKIAAEHNLKVIYDACHAIGVKYNGISLFKFGDVSVTSFHATKMINTAEGGALFTDNDELAEKIRLMRNFGYENYVIHSLGINAKMSEINASLGLASFPYLKKAAANRKKASRLYDKMLKKNSRLSYPEFISENNHSYYLVIFENESLKLSVIKALNAEKIFPREYFYPSLETVYGGEASCKIAEDISKRVLCLPLSAYITSEQVEQVCKIINKQCR